MIEACDLVVSITNVTVHLAGALAKKTWVLLPYVPNFWWLSERTDSIWYPRATLYRQPVLDDWDSVYASVRKDLETRLVQLSCQGQIINKDNRHSIAKAELEIIMNMYRQKRYDACIKEVKSKLKKFPNSVHLLNYQAMAYSALKRDNEALESYQKIIKKDPTLAGPYYNMGIILKEKWKGRRGDRHDNYTKS